MSTKKLIVANWKMYPQTLKEAREIFSKIKKTGSLLRNVQTVVCPPFVYVSELKKLVSGHRVVVGGQDVWTDQEGPYTGQVSPAQLVSVGAHYSIVGHSERRALGETDALINKKVLAGLKVGLTMVLCVGEESRDRDGAYLGVIKRQVEAAVLGVTKKDLSRLVVAYEPVWAVGKDAIHPASPADVLEVAIVIRRTIADLYGKEGGATPVLYGGSVDVKNAHEFIKQGGVEGLLIGRASLDAGTFTNILKNVDALK